ncbi:MAG TPA: VWA domain-containing protein [Vicinamibacteria bacterium]|nr:VWA domain-containing protein [Vicinamibacteria bacterium]
MRGPSPPFSFVLALLVAGSARSASAQEPPSELRREVFRVQTEVVLLDVVVRDKKGRTVRDLAPGEVEVYEDGVKQEVGNFRFLDSQAIGEAMDDAGSAAGATAPAEKPRPGESRHLNLVSLLFDQLGPDGRNIARRAALSFLELEDRPDVYVSVFQIGESLRLLQQFTTDREAVRHAVLQATGQIDTQYTAATERLAEAVGRANALQDQLDASTGTGAGVAAAGVAGSVASAQLGQQVAMANMAVNALRLTDTLQREQQGHSSLFAILALARQQQALAGRKTILFFSQGIQAPPTLEHVLLAAISEANRANVSVYAVDARGLSTASDTAAARETLREAVETSMRQQMSRGVRLVTREEMQIADTAEAALRMDAVGTLGQLAESTGGVLISHSNDVRAGIVRAVGDLRGYYEVSYSPSNREFDGRFRKIELKVTRPGTSVQTRSGYFAMPPGEGTASFSYEVQLLKAMRAAEPPHDLPLRQRAFRFGREAGGQRYTVVLELPLEGIRFEKDQDPSFERAHFSFMGVLRSSWGAVAEKFSQDSPLWLPRSRHGELKQGNAVFMRSFTLPAGRYRLETAAVDQQTGRTAVELSRLSVPARSLPVGLSSLAVVKRTEQVPKGALASDDPFRAGGVRIVPWVGEAELPPGAPLGLFFVAYVPAGSTDAPEITLEFRHDGRVVGRSDPTLPPPDAEGRIPYVASVPAAQFPPGRYEVNAELRSGPNRAWERCSFRVVAPSSPAPAGSPSS